MIVAGIGCRCAASAGQIEHAVRVALAQAGLAGRRIGRLATAAHKAEAPAVAHAAQALGAALRLVAHEDLRAAEDRVVTRSAALRAQIGLASVAEAAALVAGGPAARLLGPRIVAGPVTCALAETGDES